MGINILGDRDYRRDLWFRRDSRHSDQYCGRVVLDIPGRVHYHTPRRLSPGKRTLIRKERILRTLRKASPRRYRVAGEEFLSDQAPAAFTLQAGNAKGLLRATHHNPVFVSSSNFSRRS